METRRFDELTVALARGGSRRGVLRGLAGGVLGALALDRSALAKDKEKDNKKPETIEAKAFCVGGKTDRASCPLCSEAADLCCQGERTDPSMCATGGCSTFNLQCDIDNNGSPDGKSCVTANCKEQSGGRYRCEYTANHNACNNVSSGGFCCRVYESGNFGKCVANKDECVNG